MRRWTVCDGRTDYVYGDGGGAAGADGGVDSVRTAVAQQAANATDDDGRMDGWSVTVGGADGRTAAVGATVRDSGSSDSKSAAAAANSNSKHAQRNKCKC